MTFDPTKWNTISGQMKRGDAYQKFSYKGDVDTITTIAASGYFNEARHDLSRYDIIEVNDILSSPKQYLVLLVTARPLSGDIVTTIIDQGQSSNLVERITESTTLDDTHEYVFCDTDGGAFTVTLPAGSDGRLFRINNCGSSDNNVTLTPDGTELLFGENASELIYDGEVIDLIYESTEGWR